MAFVELVLFWERVFYMVTLFSLSQACRIDIITFTLKYKETKP